MAVYTAGFQTVVQVFAQAEIQFMESVHTGGNCVGKQDGEIAIYSRKSRFTGKGESIGNQVILTGVQETDIGQNE